MTLTCWVEVVHVCTRVTHSSLFSRDSAVMTRLWGPWGYNGNVAYISITTVIVLTLWSLCTGVIPFNSLGITRRNLQVLLETCLLEKKTFKCFLNFFSLLLLFFLNYCFPVLSIHQSTECVHRWALGTYSTAVSVAREIKSSSFLLSLSHSPRNDGVQIGTFLRVSS